MSLFVLPFLVLVPFVLTVFIVIAVAAFDHINVAARPTLMPKAAHAERCADNDEDHLPATSA
jgi:urea transporter